MQNRSILRQLKKYQVPAEQKHEITVPDTSLQHGDGIDLMALAEEIVKTDDMGLLYSPEVREEAVKKVYKKLQDMPIPPGTNKLYPAITLARYYLFYKKSWPTSEEQTDREILQFMSRVNLDDYHRQYAAYCNQTAKNLMLTRALLATFGGPTPKDKLPEECRPMICKKLNIFGNPTAGEAAKLDQKTLESADVESLILGRFGYIMLWNWIHNQKQGKLPILDQPLLGYE